MSGQTEIQGIAIVSRENERICGRNRVPDMPCNWKIGVMGLKKADCRVVV